MTTKEINRAIRAGKVVRVPDSFRGFFLIEGARQKRNGAMEVLYDFEGNGKLGWWPWDEAIPVEVL